MPNCPHCDKPLRQVYRFTSDMDRYGIIWQEGKASLSFEKNIDTEPLDGKWYCYECDKEVTSVMGDYEYA